MKNFYHSSKDFFISFFSLKNHKGAALLLVMTMLFIVLSAVLAGAAAILNNLEAIQSRGDTNKGEIAVQSALERVRGLFKANHNVFAGCGAGDCVNPTNGQCVSCSSPEATFTLSGSGLMATTYSVKISSITPAGASKGQLNIDVYGSYNRRSFKKSSTLCLDVCGVNNYNCGPSGCGGVCGVCTGEETCGGGGTPQVCGVEPPLENCSDIALECGQSCQVGDTCGGGTVFHIYETDPPTLAIAILGGCEDSTGSKCGEGEDATRKYWYDVGSEPYFVDARDSYYGYVNSSTIVDSRDSLFYAVLFCAEMSHLGFSDWYLPADEESYNMRQAYSGQSIPQDFADGCYWTSTEHDETMSYIYNFGQTEECNDGPHDKQGEFFARCMRRVQ